MIGLLAAAALSFSSCTGGLCGARELAPFFDKLDHAKGREGRPVHILQIGDSHSAGDAITGGWRDILQARYGSGGRGVLPPGRPYDGYITHGITASMSPGWSIAADFGRASADPKPPLGLSAFSLTSQQPGVTMALDADPGEAFDRFVLCALSRPGAGSLTIRAGDVQKVVSFGSPTDRPECTTIRTTIPTSHVDLATDGGPVTITSWATFGEHGGVALSNLGVVGSQLSHFGRTDDSVLAEELRAYQPDLIVLEFGTNEGFAGRFSSFEYEVILRSQISRLRRLAGNVPMLLIGAPDALTRRPELKTNAPDGDAGACDGSSVAAAPVPAPTAPGFIGTMAKIGAYLGVTGAAENGAPPAPAASAPPAPQIATSGPAPRPGLFPPAGLAAVREVQRRVASSLHVAFWDWQARLGGRCYALRWTRATPPLMRSDYVHYTAAGGREVAARLQADLDAASAK
jgi:lysophospholipase L1-like esterase